MSSALSGDELEAAKNVFENFTSNSNNIPKVAKKVCTPCGNKDEFFTDNIKDLNYFREHKVKKVGLHAIEYCKKQYPIKIGEKRRDSETMLKYKKCLCASKIINKSIKGVSKKE